MVNITERKERRRTPLASSMNFSSFFFFFFVFVFHISPLSISFIFYPLSFATPPSLPPSLPPSPS